MPENDPASSPSRVMTALAALALLLLALPPAGALASPERCAGKQLKMARYYASCVLLAASRTALAGEPADASTCTLAFDAKYAQVLEQDCDDLLAEPSAAQMRDTLDPAIDEVIEAANAASAPLGGAGFCGSGTSWNNASGTCIAGTPTPTATPTPAVTPTATPVATPAATPAAEGCSFPLVKLRTGSSTSCAGGQTHSWPIGMAANDCHGWRAVDTAGQSHDNSANDIKCNSDGSFSFVQFGGNLGCSGAGTLKSYTVNVCEQDIPPSLYTVAFDLTCCSDPGAPGCTTGLPSVTVPGGTVYRNGTACN